MALVFMDGFDYYSDDQHDDLRGKWFVNTSGTGIHAVTGRDGAGKALALVTNTNDHVFRGFPDLTTYYIGFGFKAVTLPTGTRGILETYNLHEITSGNIFLRITTSGQININRGGLGSLATSVATLSADTWYYIEMRVTVANSGGRVEVRVDGDITDWIDFTGDTNNFARLNVANAVRLIAFSDGGDCIYDDFILMDTTGSRLNGFQGDLKIETIYPDGVGNDSAWTPSAGANWEAVNEVIPNDDTDYVEATAAATEDRHTFADLVSVPATVHAVAVNVYAKRTEVGARAIRALAFDGTTEGQGADKFPTYEEYKWHQHIFEDHPSSAAVWTGSEVDSGEFGYRIQT